MGIEDKLRFAGHQLARVEGYLRKQMKQALPGEDTTPLLNGVRLLMFTQAAVNAEAEAMRIGRLFQVTGRICSN